MKSTKTYSPTGNGAVDRALSEVYKNINELFNSVNSSQASVGYGATGKSGDIRFVEGEDRLAYFEAKGNKGWYTSFAGVMVEKPAVGRPYPHFPYLEVDNLYAKIFTVNQTMSSNGNMIMSDYGIVESLTNNTITFKDQTNLNLCGFQVNDTCEVRKIKADKSLDIKKINFTVTAVSGRTITVTYSGADKVAVGDIVVRKGNTSNAVRQNAIYFSTSDTNSPYIDFYSGTTGYTFGTPIVRLGKLSGITDTDFGGALSGNGLYATNVYLKGAIRISNPTTFNNGGKLNTSNLNNDLGWTGLETYGSGSSFPVTPATGDWYFWTGAEGVYHTNTWYRYNGSSWVQFGLLGTYIDGTGIYTGTVVANNIIAGTGIVNALSILSTLTMGSALTDGIIQSYGWNGTANGFQIKGGATPSVNLIGGTITGGTIQTATSGKRVVISGTTNDLNFYNSSNVNIVRVGESVLSTFPGLAITNGVVSTSFAGTSIGLTTRLNSPGDGVGIYSAVSLSNTTAGVYGYGGLFSASTSCAYPAYGIYATATTTSSGLSWAGYFDNGDVGIGAEKFIVNGSGQLTKVNNTLPTAKYALIGDGGSFTPRLLAMSDLPALTANRVLLSDVSGYVSASTVTNTTLGYLDATSSIQTQLNGKGGLAATNSWSGLNTFTYGSINLGVASTTEGYINFYTSNSAFKITLTGLNAATSNKIINLPNATGTLSLIEGINSWTGENSFTKFKLGAEVSHSVTATGNYDCLDKNVIILTPTANGYTASLTNLSNNRPIFVVNASATYTVTVNGAVPRLLGVNEATWIMYNATSNKTYITN